MKKDVVKQKVAVARERLGVAEQDLERALGVLAEVPRPHKQIISQSLSEAFAELRAAREALDSLEETATAPRRAAAPRKRRA